MPTKGEMNLDQVKSRHVLDQSGNDIGKVEDLTLAFDPPTGLRVTGLVVKLDREAADRLRLEKPLLGSPSIVVGAERIGSIGDNILLNVGRSEIEGMVSEGSRT